MYEKTCISAPLGKKIPAGILGKYQGEPGKGQNLAGTLAGSGKNSVEIPVGVTRKRELTLIQRDSSPVMTYSAWPFPGHGKFRGTLPRLWPCQRGCQREERKNQSKLTGNPGFTPRWVRGNRGCLGKASGERGCPKIQREWSGSRLYRRGSRRGRISGPLIHGLIRVIMEIFSQSPLVILTGKRYISDFLIHGLFRVIMEIFRQAPLVILTGKRYISDSLDAITKFRSLQKNFIFWHWLVTYNRHVQARYTAHEVSNKHVYEWLYFRPS